MLRRLATWTRALGRYLTARPVRLVVAGTALLAGSLAGIPVQHRIYDYTWADAAFCDDCHVHTYANEAWARSVHAGLTTCHDCHLVPIRHYPRNVWRALTDPPHTMDDIAPPEVATVICTRCHSIEADDHPLTGPLPQRVRERVVKIDDSPMHRLHMGSERRVPAPYAGGNGHGDGHDEEHGTNGHVVVPHGVNRPSWDAGVIGCIDCHGVGPNRAHRFEATRENCIGCHEALEAHGNRLTGMDCRSCHFAGFAGVPGQPTGPAEAAHH